MRNLGIDPLPPASLSRYRAWADAAWRRITELLPSLVILAGGAPIVIGAAGTPRIARLFGPWRVGSSLDTVNSFLPIWLVVVVAGMLVAAVLRRGRPRMVSILVGCALLLAGSYPILREAAVGMQEEHPEARGPQLRVLQFNAFGNNHDLDAALAMIRKTDADVVAIEEPIKLLRRRADLNRMYPYSTPCPHDCSALLLSKHRPLRIASDFRKGNWERLPDTPGNGPITFARMDLLGRDGKPISIVAIHLFWPLPPAPAARQLDTLTRYIGQTDRTRTVLLGDFNLTPWSYAMRGLDRNLQPMTRHTRALFSWPAYQWNSKTKWPFPFLPIDHVYAGSQWRATRVDRLPRAGSDHFPVVVDLRLRP
jgi:endonuclease/exonuclease/phosphatase (EEP) superfamily protein YafD